MPYRRKINPLRMGLIGRRPVIVEVIDVRDSQ
jgi:hypothetical protein